MVGCFGIASPLGADSLVSGFELWWCVGSSVVFEDWSGYVVAFETSSIDNVSSIGVMW